MAKYLFIIILFVSYNAISQTDEDIDIMAKDICKIINENRDLPDSVKLNLALKKQVPYVASKFNLDTEDKLNAFSQRLVSRLAKTCPAFYTMVMKSAPKEDLATIRSSKPIINITKKEAEEIIKNKYHYLENNAKVYVSIKDGIWIESFEDNTYSKLYFRWVSDYEFELEFIESNNESRKYYSRKGEKYRYGIYDSESGVLKLWALNKPDYNYFIFEMYPTKKV